MHTSVATRSSRSVRNGVIPSALPLVPCASQGHTSDPAAGYGIVKTYVGCPPLRAYEYSNPALCKELLAVIEGLCERAIELDKRLAASAWGMAGTGAQGPTHASAGIKDTDPPSPERWLGAGHGMARARLADVLCQSG